MGRIKNWWVGKGRAHYFPSRRSEGIVSRSACGHVWFDSLTREWRQATDGEDGYCLKCLRMELKDIDER